MNLRSLVDFFRSGQTVIDVQRTLPTVPATGAAVVAGPPVALPIAPPEATTDNAIAKFVVGFVAALCAITFPRLLARLAQSEELPIVFFPTPYLVMAIVVALLIGFVIVIFEYKVRTQPRHTFMTALGIPALIAGALSTTSSLANLGNIKNDNERLRQQVSQESDIDKAAGSFSSIKSIEPNASPAPPVPAKKTSLLPLPVGEAHAQANAAAPEARANNEIRFGIQVQQPRYVVVLKQAQSQDEALREAQALRQQVPSAQAVKTDSGYFVVLGDSPRTETDAVLAAARVQKALGAGKLRPVLVEVK
jgi:fluoride ion exporter CrcB/FEX